MSALVDSSSLKADGKAELSRSIYFGKVYMNTIKTKQIQNALFWNLDLAVRGFFMVKLP